MSTLTKRLQNLFRQRSLKIKAAALFFVPALILHFAGEWWGPAWLGYLALPLALIAYFIAGYSVLKRAWEKFRKRDWMNEHFLMTLATLGALALLEWVEAAAIMLFYEIGEALQSLAIRRSRRSIAALLDLAENKAMVWRDEHWREVAADEVEIGERILLRPGTRIPLDCDLAQGSGSIDESALTGEAVPRNVAPGDRLLSGTLNLNSPLEATVVEVYESSTLSRILELTEEASLHKARSEQLVARFARYYTPLMVLLAVMMVVIGPLADSWVLSPIPCLCNSYTEAFLLWFQRALNLLVISCPCALVLSVPLSYFAGLGEASMRGILIKGSDVMERFALCRSIYFDKTGTLTTGRLTLLPDPTRRPEHLALAAALEQGSTHPIAQALLSTAAAESAGPQPTLEHIEEIPGQGLVAESPEGRYYLGNARLLASLNLPNDEAAPSTPAASSESGAPGNTAVHLAQVPADGSPARLLATFHFSDEARPKVQEDLKRLRHLGIHELALLSGDREAAVAKLAADLGLDRYQAELLPQDKLAELRAAIARNSRPTAFVGDGINDAPAISLADIGIAMGGIGSDAAIGAADIVLLHDELSDIATALKLSRKTRLVALENISGSLLIKLAVIILSFLGIGGLWAAVFADVGVTLLAVLNALRISSGRTLLKTMREAAGPAAQ